ncbi:DUF6404 family protein [Lysobacter xanthus]
MTFERKVEAYRALAASKGLSPATAVPPLWALLWASGVKLPPPFCMGAVSLFLVTGAFFGLSFGGVAWLMGNRGARSMSLEEGALVAVATGVLFGLLMAIWTRRIARRHAFGDWSAFGTNTPHG